MDPITPTLLLQLAFLGYAFGAVGSLAGFRNPKLANLIGFGSAAIAGGFGMAAALLSLTIAKTSAVTTFQLWPSISPFLPFSIKLDALGAFFVLIVSLLAVALSIYSLGYAQGFLGRKNIAVLASFYNVLLLATTLVFTASNAFFFLMVWEIMALSAYCLVSFEHEQDETRRAGVLFFVMSHIGTGCLMLGFLFLFKAAGLAMGGEYGSAAYSFEAFRSIGERMSPVSRNITFVLFLIGFGIKAGIVPLHVWLPAAHPVAPSNISALMSGVLIKTGIYGMTRVFFEFLGTPPNWWGVTVLAIGTISAVLGVLYALMEHDLKRLLAYHSIENIGIILIGLGASLMFLHTNHPLLASLGLIAALYHTMNHAVFKSLLFLGAGAVLHSTHSRNMEEMGGLAKRMPQTALFFLLGAVAISALPPLNGFVSEWLTYQALLQGFGRTASLIRLMFPFSGAMLALTSALAAACFVKAYGVTFLAQSRSKAASEAREVGAPMLVGQAILTGVCIFLGLFPTTFLTLFDSITGQLTGVPLGSSLNAGNGFAISGVDAEAGTVSTLGITVAGFSLLIVPFALWLLLARHTRIRKVPTWDCGLQGLTPKMEYTATGFSKPIRMIFKALFRPHREVQRDYDFSPYFAKTIRFESHVEELFLSRIYRPLNRFVLQASRRMRSLQAGTIQAYLIYIFVTLLFLLLFAL